MWLELIASVALGAGAAGIAMLLRRMAPGLPRWITPAFAGLAMIGYSIWLEYTWYPQTRETMPEGFEVISTVESSEMWKPWTYLAPQITRFAVVDAATARRNSEHPGLVLADVLLYQRYTPVKRVPILIDCPQKRRADISDGVDFDANGAPQADRWTDIPQGDPLLAAICKN